MNFHNLLTKYTDFTRDFFKSFTPCQKYIFTITGLFLSAFIVVTRYLLYCEDYVWNTKFFFAGLTFTAVYTFAVFNVIIFLIHKLLKYDIKISLNKASEEFPYKTWFLYGSICFFVLMICFGAYFPGAIYSDNCEQWKQVQSFIFEDWHPVLHTLIIWLFSRIINHYSFFIFSQIVLFSTAVGYLTATMQYRGFPKWVLNVVIFSIVGNMMTRNIMMCAVKDCMLAIFMVILITFLLNVYLTKGEWFRKPINIIMFAACAAITSLIRHNAVLLTIPLLLMIFFIYGKRVKQAITAVILSFVFIIGIKGPLYAALDTARPDNFFEESISMPMTIISDVYIKNPEAITPETMEMLMEIADEEKWHRVHVMSHYVYIRFDTDACNIIKKVPMKKFIKMALDTIKADPYNSMVAVRDITDLAWKSEGRPEGVFKIDYQGESIGYLYKEQPFQKYFKAAVKVFDTGLNLPLLSMLMMMTGVQMILLMFFGLLSYCRNGASSLMFVMPTIIYNFGTMWYLCNDDYRYFFFNAVVTIPVLFILTAKKQPELGE